jgi:hypothetical protein
MRKAKSSAAPLHNFCGLVQISEMIFPQNGVRFIAINDGVDSARGENDMSALRNLFNEWMVRDTSKKIKAVFRAKGASGMPITSQPVYGYLKGPDGHFVVDPEAAPVVKQIFSLCLAGNGPTKIARMLTEQNIPTPGTMEYRRTGSTRRYYPDYPCKWSSNTVAHILERREYLGHTVNFKTEKVSYKVKTSVANPEDKVMVFLVWIKKMQGQKCRHVTLLVFFCHLSKLCAKYRMLPPHSLNSTDSSGFC